MIDTLTYQEMLRTLGAFVEIANATDVGLVVSLEEGALVYGRGWPGPTLWTMADIGDEANSQRSWRYHPRRDRTPRAGPIADCLRAIGAILDADADSQGPYTLTVDSGCVRLQGRQGAESRFEFAPQRADAMAAAPRATSRDRRDGVPRRPRSATAIADDGAPSGEAPSGEAPSDAAAAIAPRGPAGGPLTYEETLRTLSTLFDTTNTREAVIRLSPHGAEVVAGAWRGPFLWDGNALQSAAAHQRAHRLVARYARARRSRESTGYLRVVGAELDRQGHRGEYVLKLRGSQVAVETATGETWTFEREAIEQLESGVQRGRGQGERREERQPAALYTG